MRREKKGSWVDVSPPSKYLFGGGGEEIENGKKRAWGHSSNSDVNLL